MRINKKLIKKHNHASQLRIPKLVKDNFANAIHAGDVPNHQQIKLAIKMGLVKQNDHGGLDAKSLSSYFKTFIQQRKTEHLRK